MEKLREKGGGLVLGVLFVFFAVLSAFSAWKLISAQQEYDAGTDVYAALAQSAVIRQEPQPDLEEDRTPTVSLPTQVSPEQPLTLDFTMLEGINHEVVGWISSKDGINYPVVQGSDNEYYLNHLFDGTVNRNGSIFVDYRNASDFTDRNTFIYGHNMRNGTMFASLANYSSQSYYEQYPELILTTPERMYSLQVFAGYVTPGNSDIYQLTYENDEAFAAYLRKVRVLSDFSSEVTVTEQDCIVTLSTCTYDYDDARYVLHCRILPMQ